MYKITNLQTHTRTCTRTRTKCYTVPIYTAQNMGHREVRLESKRWWYTCASEDRPTQQTQTTSVTQNAWRLITITHDESPTGIVPAYTSRRVADGDRTGIYITTRRRRGSYRHIHRDASPTGIVPAYTSGRVADGDRTSIYITTRRRRGSYRHIHHDASPTGIVSAYTSRRVADGDRTGIYIATRLAGDYLSATICLFRHTRHDAVICLRRFVFNIKHILPRDKDWIKTALKTSVASQGGQTRHDKSS